MNQIVYILKNESMPEYVKIGFTHGDVKERLKQLDRTGVPLPFEVYYAATVEDAEKEERWLHSIFADRRARDSREFFKMNPEYAALALKRVEIRETKIDSGLTPEQEKEVDEVKENNKIKINGKVNSLSSFAKELLGYQRQPQGTLYFEFEDEILDDRRRRMDEGEPTDKEIEAAGDAWMQQQADIERGK